MGDVAGRRAANQVPPPPQIDRFRVDRRVTVGLPVAIATLSLVAALVQLDCTSDCFAGGAIMIVSPLTAPIHVADGATAGAEPQGGLLFSLVVAYVAALAWWKAIARVGAALAHGRKEAGLVFWGLWLLAWVVTYISNMIAFVLVAQFGWILPSVLQALLVAAVLIGAAVARTHERSS